MVGNSSLAHLVGAQFSIFFCAEEGQETSLSFFSLNQAKEKKIKIIRHFTL